MRNSHPLRRGLAAVLAALTLTQCAPLTASAAWWSWSKETTAVEETVAPLSAEVQLQDGTAIIPADSDNAAVKQALFDALVVNKEGVDPQSLDWEYYCTGKNGLLTNDAWGSVNGFTSEKKVVFVTTTYTHPALVNNDDGSYQVRIKGTTEEVTLTKAAKLSSSIVLNEGCSVALPYKDDGTVNYDALRESIFDAVVNTENSTPAGLTASDVTIEYYATADSGSLGNMGKAWMPLEGGSDGLLTYPAISAGDQQIRVSYAGTDTVYGTSAETAVTFTERTAGSIVLKAGQSAGLTYKADGTVDYDALRSAIFNAVVDSTTPELTLSDVTIGYCAQAESDSVGSLGKAWMPLEGGKDGLLTYPAMTLGNDQQVRISWGGNGSYTAASAETTVNIVEGREQVPYTLKTTPDDVTLAVDESLAVDYAALKTAIFAAVVEQSDVLSVSNVTITYYTKALTDVDAKYVALEGEKGTILNWPAISAGEQKIRISYAGDQTYAPVTIEATVTVKDREQVQFVLNEGPYEVGMKFTADQGYDYAATAAAIYDAVVASTVNPQNLTAADVTVEYNAGLTGFKPLNETDVTGLVKFGEGKWEIRISWAGSREYRGNHVDVTVTTTDSRLASVVALKSGVSFTYNMDPAVMEQAIFDNLIDWDNSTLPARETLTIDNFTIEYKAKLTDAETGVDVDLSDLEGILGKLPGLGDLVTSDALTQWVPIEGKEYKVLGQLIGAFPQMGAGENQAVRITYNGGAEYKPSSSEGTVTVNKAKVTVSVHSDNIYAGDPIPEGFITTNPADKFDMYTIYAGITSNVTTGIYLDLPDRYTAEGSLLLKVIDQALAAIGQKTLTQMLNEGVTVGELRELFNTQGLLDLLGKLNIDTGTFGQIMTVINKLPGILDSVRISFGTPSRAGLYTVAVVTDSKNYNTGVGMGFLLVRMRLSGSNLTWNADIPGGKLTAEEAKSFDFGATLSYNGDVSIDQSSVHYLYSGFTSSWRIYSSTTTPPTEPGRYVVTVCILGGNYLAAPLTRSFQITK